MYMYTIVIVRLGGMAVFDGKLRCPKRNEYLILEESRKYNPRLGVKKKFFKELGKGFHFKDIKNKIKIKKVIYFQSF